MSRVAMHAFAVKEGNRVLPAAMWRYEVAKATQLVDVQPPAQLP